MQPIASVRTSNNKRRFSDEQVKSLEFMFESESRPESRMKQRLADELGLQPRQVAIWFQNKRARSKTKHIELEYNKLKAEFEALACSYESMKTENQSLLLQLQKLKNILGKHHDGNKNRELDCDEKSGREGKSESEETIEWKEGPSNIYVPSGDGMSRNVVNTVEDIAVMNLEEHTESSGNLCKYDSNFPDESNSASQWWELWS